MKFHTNTSIPAIALVIILISVPLNATTLLDIKNGIDDQKCPDSLTSIIFMGTMMINTTENAIGLIPQESAFVAAWKSPDAWYSTWELSGEVIGGSDA